MTTTDNNYTQQFSRDFLSKNISSVLKKYHTMKCVKDKSSENRQSF
jgi:hypothetical protein